METPTEETRNLRRCVRELTALSALSVAWGRSEPPAIADSLAEVLLLSLPVDFVYVRLTSPAVESSDETVRTDRGPGTARRAREVGEALDPILKDGVPGPTPLIANPVGEGEVRLAVIPIGYEGNCGVLVAGSQQEGFPSQNDRLLLGVAANQAAVVLQHKRSEASLREAKEVAEAASRAKDQFLAMLSHELRTPLTPILLTATALQSDPEVSPELRSTFEMIRQNVELEVRLIDDLLDVMRIIRGKMPYQFEVVDAHALIRRTWDTCLGEIDDKGVHILLDLSACEHEVQADTARLQQVLWNLVKNSVKFTPRGGTVSIRSRNGAPGRLIIEVSDTGIGIEPQHLEKVFNAFEQVEDSITRRFGGLGLGLAISRSIAEAHGGSLTVASEGKDRGATFTLDLPTVAHADRIEPRPVPWRDGEAKDRNHRILLVEDDAMTTRVMAKLLRQVGFTVTAVDTVAGALEVPSEEYDLVISDLGLPDGSGLELMRRIRSRREVPGIALTGLGTDDDIRKARDAGFTAHLTKPVDFTKLDAMIQQVVAAGEPTASDLRARKDRVSARLKGE